MASATVTYPCYWQYKDTTNQWRWTYFAKNKEKIAVSSESYHNRADCTHAVNLMKGSGNDPLFYQE
ncbi:hypothetical protein D3C80_2096990 [compost metagenome]